MRKQYNTISSIILIIMAILYACYVVTFLSRIKLESWTDYLDFDIGDTVISFVLMFLLYEWIFVGIHLILRYVYSAKILKILFDECDPVKYLMEHDSFHKPNTGSLKIQSLNYLNKYSAYTYLGEFDFARQIILSSPPPEIVKSQLYAALYNINAAHQDIIDGDYEKARQRLEYVRNMKMPKNIRMTYAFAIDGNEAAILRKQGHLEESRKLYSSVLQRAVHKIYILNCTYALGLIDIEEQKYDEARTAFTKVAEEGNKLYIASQAKQALLSMTNHSTCISI